MALPSSLHSTTAVRAAGCLTSYPTTPATHHATHTASLSLLAVLPPHLALAMTSRRIPIQQPQRPAQTQNTGFKSSSLDAVFSFQRSAQFFGENLPSAASFVDPSRYPRPPDDWSSGEEDEEEDDDEEEAVGGKGRRARRREMSETTEDEEESEVTDGHEPSSSEAWHSTHDEAEQLPPNAVARGGGSRRASAAGWNGTAVPASERSPLLAPFRPAAANGSYLSSGVDITEEPDQVVRRRPSTFSKEAWKAAIEEHRGESTWSQSLFNTCVALFLSLRPPCLNTGAVPQRQCPHWRRSAGRPARLCRLGLDFRDYPASFLLSRDKLCVPAPTTLARSLTRLTRPPPAQTPPRCSQR